MGIEHESQNNLVLLLVSDDVVFGVNVRVRYTGIPLRCRRRGELDGAINWS